MFIVHKKGNEKSYVYRKYIGVTPSNSKET